MNHIVQTDVKNSFLPCPNNTIQLRLSAVYFYFSIVIELDTLTRLLSTSHFIDARPTKNVIYSQQAKGTFRRFHPSEKENPFLYFHHMLLMCLCAWRNGFDLIL